MPITMDEFEDTPEELLGFGEGSQARQVLSFLVGNPDQAFTQKELHEETGIKKGSLGAVLSRLEERDLVRHRGKFWAVAEDDRLASFAAMTEGTSSSVNDRY